MKENTKNTPILFLVFNRPDTTEKVFEAIKAQRPTRLYVAADGPRSDRPQEAANCQLTREIATNVDWPCEVKTLFRTENLGCGKAVSQAISWFFEQEEEGIILEDDCLPHPDFFAYCTELLDRYRDVPHIKTIGGNNFQNGMKWGEASYYSSAHVHVWGWATWRRVWQEYEFDVSGWDVRSFEESLGHYFISNAEKKYWKNIFSLMQEKRIDTWDYQFFFSVWKYRGLSITPNVNLVSNIGFGDNATHTFENEHPLSNVKVGKITPLRHMTHDFASNYKVADYYFSRYYLCWDRFFILEKRVIPFLSYFTRFKSVFN